MDKALIRGQQASRVVIFRDFARFAQHEYAKEVEKKLHKIGIRVVLDDRNEKVGYKIREAQLEKVPYMLVIGAKEVEENTVSIRSRESAENETMKVDEFVARIKDEVENKTK